MASDSKEVAALRAQLDPSGPHDGMTSGGQLDLFSASGISPENHARSAGRHDETAPADLDDDALIAALPSAGMLEAVALAAEAGRRRLVTAVPALDQLCRRFAGFGRDCVVPEQIAALRALALISGLGAARTVTRLIARNIVQGPTIKAAVNVAAQLKATLPANTILSLLRHADPDVRADACRCACLAPEIVPILLDLINDSSGKVSTSALCALGRMGRREARPALTRLLRTEPCPEVIEAIPALADEDCMILLGRVARTQPALADAALEALEMIDHPRARQLVAGIAAEQREAVGPTPSSASSPANPGPQDPKAADGGVAISRSLSIPSK